MGPGPIAEPEPLAVAAYGVFPVEPVPIPELVEPEVAAGGATSFDFDAGAADPEADGGERSGLEPEPSVGALYGVPPVSVE
jgi:hypothetical protein